MAKPLQYWPPAPHASPELMGLPRAGATIFAGGSSMPFVFFGFFSLLAPSSAIPSAAGIASTVGAGNTNVVQP